jgi:hypothetical protein
VIRRRLLSASLLFVLVAMAGLGLCSGWDASASMRMACCAKGEVSQAPADSCCALGEPRRNADTAPTPAVAGLAATDVTQRTIAFLSAVPVLQGSRSDAVDRDHVAATSDTHLLLSVFLI